MTENQTTPKAPANPAAQAQEIAAPADAALSGEQLSGIVGGSFTDAVNDVVGAGVQYANNFIPAVDQGN